MKKITSQLIMLLYLIPALGLTVSLHYCGGKISSISFFTQEGKCGCGNKKMKKNCCKDKTINIQLSDEQQNVSASPLSFLNNNYIPIAFPVYNGFFHQCSFVKDVAVKDNHPPDNDKHRLYIQQRVFRI